MCRYEHMASSMIATQREISAVRSHRPRPPARPVGALARAPQPEHACSLRRIAQVTSKKEQQLTAALDAAKQAADRFKASTPSATIRPHAFTAYPYEACVRIPIGPSAANTHRRAHGRA